MLWGLSDALIQTDLQQVSEPGSLSCSRTRLLIDTFAAIAGTRPVTPSVNFCTTRRCRLMNQKGRTARDRDICKPDPQTAHTCHLNDQCEKCTSKQLTYSHTSIRSASARSLRNPGTHEQCNVHHCNTKLVLNIADK